MPCSSSSTLPFSLTSKIKSRRENKNPYFDFAVFIAGEAPPASQPRLRFNLLSADWNNPLFNEAMGELGSAREVGKYDYSNKGTTPVVRNIRTVDVLHVCGSGDRDGVVPKDKSLEL